MNTRRAVPLIALTVAGALLVSSCSSDDTTTATSTTSADTAALKGLSGTLTGGGSSFQDTFEQQVLTDFNQSVKDAGGSLAVTYTKSGSSDGKKSLADKTLDFAGSDSPIKPEERAAFGTRKVLYFPIVGGPIAVAFHLDGVDALNLSPDTVAKIFQAQITTWNDPAIAADNPGAKLPSTPITVVHRSDGSGTTKNFTKYLTKAAPSTWKLDAGEEVQWPAKTQGAEKSTGVTSVVKDTNGGVTYADLADAAKEDLSVAAIGNANKAFVAPTPANASAALAAATVESDLTYDPLAVDAADAYPITSPTWILVDAKQASAAKAAAVKAYLRYALSDGQSQAKVLLYAPLPDALREAAVKQIDQITAG